MFNPLKWLDDVLLGAAQKLCDKVQKITGLTKFRLEKWAMIMLAVFFGVAMICLSSPPSVLVALFPLLAISVASGVHAVEKEEVEFLRNGNLRKPIFGVFGRIMWVAFYGFLVSISLSTWDYVDKMLACGDASYILFVYFDSCIPRPPSKSKARELCDKMLTVLNDMLKPVPVPAQN